MGVHGSGLTNMVFLPSKAIVIEIIPWGELKWLSRISFGDPAREMGLSHMDYEIGKQESSLIDQYPSDHRVLTNPLAIQKFGNVTTWLVYFIVKMLDLMWEDLDLSCWKPFKNFRRSTNHECSPTLFF
jgi:hypothetical protein